MASTAASQPVPAEVKKRNKMRDQLYDLGKQLIDNRTRMPLVSEDKAKNEFLYQEAQEDGIVTLA